VPAFSNAVNRAVSRILAFSLLLTGFMLAMGFPLLDLILRGGKFQRADSHAMALYFSVFSLSLCLWAAQAIYARAFYAAGNTLLPMINCVWLPMLLLRAKRLLIIWAGSPNHLTMVNPKFEFFTMLAMGCNTLIKMAMNPMVLMNALRQLIILALAC